MVAVRLAALGCYLGLGPMLAPWRRRREDELVAHHFAQAHVVLLFALGAAAAWLLSWAVGFWISERSPGMAWFLSSAFTLVDGVTTLLLVTAPLAWVSGAALAVAGSRRALPLVGRLASRRGWVRAGIGLTALTWVVGLSGGGLALHATSLERADGGPARAYLLYDSMGIFPHELFSLGFYPIARAATERWGEGSVAVAPLTRESLRDALRHGTLVFVAAHGAGGRITLPGEDLAPGDFASAAGKRLRFVYITACEGSARAREWEKTLAPAEVRTFGKESPILEHVGWLWGDGPERIRSLR